MKSDPEGTPQEEGWYWVLTPESYFDQCEDFEWEIVRVLHDGYNKGHTSIWTWDSEVPIRAKYFKVKEWGPSINEPTRTAD